MTHEWLVIKRDFWNTSLGLLFKHLLITYSVPVNLPSALPILSQLILTKAVW